MQWVFETLGIDKQADVSTVRKAYAKAIKQCDQVTEADRFQRIRQAYEFALQWAKQREASTPAIPEAESPNEAPTNTQQPATPTSTTLPHIVSQPVEPPSQVQSPLGPQPLEPSPLAPQPDQAPYARPTDAPRVASLQAMHSRIEPQPLKPRPVALPLPASTAPRQVVPFKAGERIAERNIGPSPDHTLSTEDTQASAKAVLQEFLTEARKPSVISIAGVLGKYANDVRLTSLDAKAEFEQVLLVHIFSGLVYVSVLDAACDLFAWETSYRHLAMRPDLVQRMLRHQSLRHLLAASGVHEELHWAMRAYVSVQQQPGLVVEPWEIVKANRMLERFDAFKQELGERYNAEAFEWWRQKLTSNPTLLASYRENKPAQETPPPVPRRSQQTARRQGGSLIWLWPVLAILGIIAGHTPSSTPNGDPSAYTSPARVSNPSTTPRQVSTANDPYLMNIDALRRIAVQGDPTAQNLLGNRYARGIGVAQDTQMAGYWYRRAADQGFPEAQYQLGELYWKGDGLAQNTQLAVEWWHKAAKGGNAPAQNRLAEAYARGDGIKKDYQAARSWWQEAAFHNIPNAEAGLGWLYENGYGTPRDTKAAIDHYRKAASQGDVTGQLRLASMYERGKGVPADPVIAVALLTVATEHLNPNAQGGREAWADLDRISAELTPAQHAAASQLARALSSTPVNFLATLDTTTQLRHSAQGTSSGQAKNRGE
jgi:TPR repeat protein